MGNTSKEIDVIAIIAVIISILGVIISVLLVKEGRKFLFEKIDSIKKILSRIWEKFANQAFFLLIIGWIAIVIFLKIRQINQNLAILLALLLLIVYFISILLYKSVQKNIQVTDQELFRLSSVVRRITEIEKVELNMVRERWGIFLESVSNNVSLTAVNNILQMAEPFDVNGSNLVVMVPNLLEPSIKNLGERFKDVEPLLEQVFEKPYKLLIHTTVDSQFFSKIADKRQ